MKVCQSAALFGVVLLTACGGSSGNKYASAASGATPAAPPTTTTPDGVVVGVQSLEHRVDGSLAFWTEAITRRVRDQQGYALVSEEDVRSASGESGHLMRFARDLDGHGYKYSIALFVTPDRIYLVEAGGRTVAYDALESGIEEAINQMRL